MKHVRGLATVAMAFLFIICSFALGTAWLWYRADRSSRRFQYARIWRVGFALFYGSLIMFLIVPISRMIWGSSEPGMPSPIFATEAYLWHPVLLPMFVVATMISTAVGIVRRRRMRRLTAAAGNESSSPVPSEGLSRRQMFRAVAAAALPPVASGVVTGVALAERGDFRVRSVDLTIPNLPEDLDGLTIAHLTDLHAGNFLPQEMIPRLVEATNAMQADLVVFTGDLIDRGQLDRLPDGLKLLREIDPRHGLVIIEGNHDLFDDSNKFESAMAEFGDRFIVEGQKTFELPSKRTPGKPVKVQFLGIPWGDRVIDEVLGRTRTIRIFSPEALSASVRRVAAMVQPNAFPILLAHHPHAFDTAVECRLPLTLSGHTHGGQVMLTENIGAGPLRFKYWNGAHERDGCQLVISNGIGAWFPLRVNAPAEILKLTLKRHTP
jgi:predicted MPP superfamily phosphohydrolase